jgi:hypothetical protein
LDKRQIALSSEPGRAPDAAMRSMFARLCSTVLVIKDADVARPCLTLYLIHTIHLKIVAACFGAILAAGAFLIKIPTGEVSLLPLAWRALSLLDSVR